MNIHLATDHAGYEMKEAIKLWLLDLDYAVIDYGADHFDEHDDYPDIIGRLAEALSNNPDDAMGIIFGGSGQGEAIVANRFPHVRAVVYYGPAMAEENNIITLSRQHNDANVLSIGARCIDVDHAKEIINIWLNTEFSGDDRHVRRLQKIDRLI